MLFQEFPKMARLNRNCVITEKIDGTNAQVIIADENFFIENEVSSDDSGHDDVITRVDGLYIFAGSRTRIITPQNDNHGFAKWVLNNAPELSLLGPGRHFGEWWGGGVQRGYGFKKGEKFFSLFNTSRWNKENIPPCCSVVPVIYEGPFSTNVVEGALERLREKGSFAAPDFMKPEGVVVFHSAQGFLFKVTLEGDEVPKSIFYKESK